MSSPYSQPNGSSSPINEKTDEKKEKKSKSEVDDERLATDGDAVRLFLRRCLDFDSFASDAISQRVALFL